MANAEKILPLFIHDLRTPIGVAQGYVRLLQEQRLASPEERENALARAMDALGRLSRLCNEASSFLADGSGPAAVAVDASALTALVGARIRDQQLAVTGQVDRAARLLIAGDPDRLAEAIAAVLGTVAGPGGKLADSVLMETRMSELRFAVHRKGSSPGNDTRVPFDPWRGHGLGVALADHLIAAARGAVWTTGAGILVSFPLEISA